MRSIMNANWHRRTKTYLGAVLVLILTIALGFGAVSAVKAQPAFAPTGPAISPVLVGNNVWYNPDSSVWSAVAPAGLKIIRIGGISYDNSIPSNAQLTTWVNNIKAIGAEPMIQVSQYRTAAQAADVVRYFNVTTGNRVKYWNIGNEPWLERGRPADSTMGPIVEGYVKPIASAMKAVDPTIKIFAPDECDYMNYYNALLGGANDITGLVPGKNYYYIDGISWHRYANTSSLASDMISRIQSTRARVDYANNLHGRTGANALSFGVGEFNSNPGGGGTCSFANGQAIARTYGALMKYGGAYAALWSFKEGGSSCDGTDFGFLNGNNTPRPSYYHMQMVARNFSGIYADGTSNISSLYAFGAVDSNKLAVMLVNTGSGSQTCSVRLNNDAVSGSCQVKIGADVPATVSQAIPGQTSMVLLFNSSGQLYKRITYTSGGTPQEQNIAPTPPPTTPPPTTPPPSGTVRIEAGGTANYTDPGGNVWLSDRGFTGGSVVDRGAIAIANTTADRVYQTERYGMSAFAQAVPNGTYQVNLHFAETYTGVTAAGQRVFSVNVEGTALNNLDIFALAGGRNIALVRTVTVTVNDGTLNMTFTAMANSAEINGIEIIPGAPSGNLALNRPATSSSNESGSYTPNLAVDGNAATRWSSAFSDPQWITVDLGNTYNINRVVLNWEAAYGRTYQIQVSNDGSNWSTVYSTSTGDGGTDDLNVSGSGRYIRMYGTARGTAYGYSLWEFQVYGG